jgi:ATP-dependent DNA helicase RecQ
MDLKRVKKVRKSAAPRERASDTKRVSFDMFRSGNSLEDIAENRQLSVSTIETHLSYYITTGELDINEIVSEDKQELIAQAMQKFGRLGLRQLKDNLPEEISYGEIKMMAALTGR